MTQQEKERMFLDLNDVLVKFWIEQGRPDKAVRIELLERMLNWYKKMGTATLDKQSKEPVNEGLEEVAENIYKVPFGTRAEDFIAGAVWQKGQMLKDAVEGEVCGRVRDHINVRFADGVSKYLEPKNISHIPADISKYAVGDGVKIVIVPIKEDKK